MSGLLQVVERNEQQVVHARDLYAALEVRRDFSTWIKDRVEKYGFMEGEDFSPDLGKNTGGSPPVGMAKDTIQVAKDTEE